MKPTLIVTCKAGSEEWCEEEIGNVLFIHDPDVKVVRTRYPGLLLVYSNLDPYKAYVYALSSEYGFIKNIIPIHLHDKFSLENISKILEIVGVGERIKVKLRIRGKRGLSKVLWKHIMDLLKSKNAVHDPRSNMCLYIEVIDNDLFIGRAKC
ncbi:hypothetical protein [Staphylothermus hellenicus]|uniref:THUMP domain-containing protein n=1 Tax=Staphylothermus hellenicus (strain DSM 12710 / JCM 10830 / BK20S6-10-b1 / P8) TaxID=591019 RepID=D7D988_STAHD|nr:hypothetical protein [Staphylothermus hellenicus]ADI32334.1 hypothetical protein Shell_1235 [Staphylothermus hellenicus DSM 12710]